MFEMATRATNVVQRGVRSVNLERALWRTVLPASFGTLLLLLLVLLKAVVAVEAIENPVEGFMWFLLGICRDALDPKLFRGNVAPNGVKLRAPTIFDVANEIRIRNPNAKAMLYICERNIGRVISHRSSKGTTTL